MTTEKGEKVSQQDLIHQFWVKGMLEDGSLRKLALIEVPVSTLKEAEQLLLERTEEVVRQLKDPYGRKVIGCEFDFIRSFTLEQYEKERQLIEIGQAVLRIAHNIQVMREESSTL